MSDITSHKNFVHDSAKADEIWAILEKIAAESSTEPDRTICYAVFGNSPFLAEYALRCPQQAYDILTTPANSYMETLLNHVDAIRPEGEKRDDFSAFLRQCKSKASLAIAAADISGEWNLSQVTGALSKFADGCVKAILRQLFHERMKNGELAWPHGDEPALSDSLVEASGYFVLGMGKLGAGELNYSSDIDLIVFYDPDKIAYTGRKSLKECFIKITQELVHLLDTRTLWGYVFRTDLRLRPDPGATPVAIAVGAAESYYHSMAVNWERSAMIKARVIAGDQAAGAQFLKNMESWVWRRNMDFAALQDIAAIKNQINRHYDQEPGVKPGYNVKLGIGGIREIEFFAQVNQLLHAGRHPTLRVTGTLPALEELARLQIIENAVCETLKEAYLFLRMVEHRLQMIDDAQTHELPKETEELKRVAAFTGFDTPDALLAALTHYSEKVSAIYDTLLPDHQASGAQGYDSENLPGTLEGLGYSSPEMVSELIEGWRRGRYKALRTPRAKNMLEECLPNLLKAFADTDSPQSALIRFDKFLSQLPTGVQMFALFHSNPSLFKLIARVMGLAPALAETLGKKPELWDMVLEPAFFAPLEDEATLAEDLSIRLSSARDFQDILDFVRRFVAEQKFRLGVHLLESVAGVLEVGEAMTRVTDVAMKALIPKVCDEFSRRHGDFENGGIAMLAMGKYGGRELTHTSDLDVVFLYHVEHMNSSSNGDKPLMPSQYFSRLGQNIITAITALTPEGRLFEVDTRLRPSGSQGPLAVTLKTFEDYYEKSAWTWEHMALTRARLIIAPDGFGDRVMASIRSVLVQPRNSDALVVAVHQMRNKLFENFGSENKWAIKHTKGGLVDLEFICQYLMLKGGHDTPDIFEPELSVAIQKLEKHGLLSTQECRSMESAHILMQKTQSLLRLSVGSAPQTSDDIPVGLKHILEEATQTASFENLEMSLEKAQATIYSIYEEIIGKPARALENQLGSNIK